MGPHTPARSDTHILSARAEKEQSCADKRNSSDKFDTHTGHDWLTVFHWSSRGSRHTTRLVTFCDHRTAILYSCQTSLNVGPISLVEDEKLENDDDPSLRDDTIDYKKDHPSELQHTAKINTLANTAAFALGGCEERHQPRQVCRRCGPDARCEPDLYRCPASCSGAATNFDAARKRASAVTPDPDRPQLRGEELDTPRAVFKLHDATLILRHLTVLQTGKHYLETFKASGRTGRPLELDWETGQHNKRLKCWIQHVQTASSDVMYTGNLKVISVRRQAAVSSTSWLLTRPSLSLPTALRGQQSSTAGGLHAWSIRSSDMPVYSIL
ncbi:hypothetical protein RRG08_041930 [Elysia crispata]|uniref:Uncharacterized protein n=1 Tax=Elysia crispata TaxID=231223 RepID=A0AAE0XXR3_9GAST|nr:hypothetical protein RRG08_041930 [Elysia crispata]